jgi:transposase InsO family protein
MPWKEVSVMEQRVSFVLRVKAAIESFAGSCRRYAISRETGYKWWRRFRRCGLAGLKEQSRRPQSCPHQSPRKWHGRTVRVRLRYPHWGPKKIRAKLAAQYGGRSLPAASTLGRILKAHGLVRTRRWRRRGPALELMALQAPSQPNEVWAVDFKGWFRTGDGQRCDPLTLSDLYSRYVLDCRVVADHSYEATRPGFERIFVRYGLPQKIRVDNGSPFGSSGAGGWSRLSVWWLRLGIAVEFTRPGHPQDNGVHERMHRTLKAETTQPPAQTPRGQQRRFDRWCVQFNEQRPHEALQQRVPAEQYRLSARTYTGLGEEPQYPAEYAVRRVRSNGEIKWAGRRRFVGEAFCGQRIGIKRVSSQRLQVYFFEHLLGELHEEETGGLRPAVRRVRRSQSCAHRVGAEGGSKKETDGRACSRGRGESVTQWRPAATRPGARKPVAAARPPARTKRRELGDGKE